MKFYFMVAVNHLVAGSSPARGASQAKAAYSSVSGLFSFGIPH
jgi:hypothetical protein